MLVADSVLEPMRRKNLERWRELPLTFPSQAMTFRASVSVPYRLYTPQNPCLKSPLIVYLHHAQAVGIDNVQSVFGSEAVGRMIEECVESDVNAYLLVPQSQVHWEPGEWGRTPTQLSPTPTPTLQTVKDLIDAKLRCLPIDADRIILIGQSMGAFGVWDALARWPGFFSSAAAVCGGGDPGAIGNISKTPVWAFHGNEDEVIPVERSRMMAHTLALNSCNYRYSEYTGAGHDEGGWLAWSEPDLVSWLLSWSKKHA